MSEIGQNSKKLFLLDAYALIFRAYYAFIKNPRINSKGENTSAIFGFTNSLMEVMRKERPTHLAVAFDVSRKTVRHDYFPEYKSNREETPEVILFSVPYIQRIIKAFNISILSAEGYEADDVIGTIACQAEKFDFDVFMLTPDKDFAQLVTDHIKVYRPSRSGNGVEIWGVDEVKEKFGVQDPKQVIDFLGMMGDSVDNIPGLPGVGEKTAKKFLAEYGSMEALLDNTHELKGKMKERIEENKKVGILSKKLATILLDAPVQFDPDTLQLETPNIEEVKTIFQKLEFRQLTNTFLKYFDPKYSTASAQENHSYGGTQSQLFVEDDKKEDTQSIDSSQEIKTIETAPHFYQIVNSPTARKLLLNSLLNQTEVCFDTETTSLDSLTAELVGIAFSCQKGKGYYLVLPEELEQSKSIVQEFQEFFSHPTILKIGHNLKYDIKVLYKYEIEVFEPIFDTMVAHYLIQPDMRHNMDALAESYLRYKPVSITELIGKKGKNQQSMRSVELEKQKEYAVEDADVTLQLKEIFEQKLKESNAFNLFREVETPLVSVLSDMEINGIRIDANSLSVLSAELSEDLLQLEQSIYKHAGTTFNIASPKQLAPILFEQLKLVDKPKKTKTGQYSTAEDVLRKLKKKHPIIVDLLNFRQLQKLKSTYVDALPKEQNKTTGRVHTIFSQAVAATGRLSSNNPNLQNIPIRTQRGREIRKVFIPRDENFILLAADYSQIELRLIAAMSQDQIMIESFQNGEDIHAATASKVFNVSIDEVSREQRSQAKTVNFGIIYGVSAFGLSEQTNLSRSKSKELIETYFATYPNLKKYMENQVEYAREKGYVETILGRRRYLKDINSRNHIVRGHAERNAINAPIQGSAADVIKLAMIRIHHLLKKEKTRSKMILQVHDELVFDMHKEELRALAPIIKKEMETAYELSVPLVVDIGNGSNWLEAH